MIYWIGIIILGITLYFNFKWFAEILIIAFLWTMIVTFFECLLKE